MIVDELKKSILENLMYGKYISKHLQSIKNKIPISTSDMPKNWKFIMIGDAISIARGGSPRPIKSYLTTSEEGVNWIKIGDTVKGSKYINSCKEKIMSDGVKKSRLVHKGDFLLSNSMSFGRPYILNIDGCIHDGWLVLTDKNNLYLKDFLFYVLSSNFVYNQFCDKASGAVVNNLNTDKVRETIIPLPPLEEQQMIVDKIEELFTKLDEIKPIEDELINVKMNFPSVMKKSILLYNILKTQDNVELTNYNEIKLPDDWKWVKFSNIADCKMGKTILKKDLMSSGIPVYSATNSDNVLGYINDCDLILTKGDLVIPARGNSIGYATFIQEEKATCTQTAIACYPKSIINSKFLYYCCYAFKNIWFKFTGSAIPQITISNINENYIPLPPLEEQQRIVDKLEQLLPLCDDIEKLVGV